MYNIVDKFYNNYQINIAWYEIILGYDLIFIITNWAYLYNRVLEYEYPLEPESILKYLVKYYSIKYLF